MAVTAHLSVFALIAFVVLVGQQVAAGVFVGHRPPFPLPDNAGLLFLPQDTGSGYRPLPLRRGDIYGWAFRPWCRETELNRLTGQTPAHRSSAYSCWPTYQPTAPAGKKQVLKTRKHPCNVLESRRVESNHPHRKGSPARTACGICPASPGVNYFFRFLK